MKKVLILGVLGMAGHIMAEVFNKNDYKVYGVAREKGNYVDKVLDVSDSTVRIIYRFYQARVCDKLYRCTSISVG
jgi:GDP-D-mannose dehydratase